MKMKKIIVTAIIILICSQTVFAADPVEGFWLGYDSKTGEIQTGWEIYESNGYMCGKIVSGITCTPEDKAVKCKDSYANFPVQGKANQLTIFNTPWIFGLTMEKPGYWTNGNIINVEDGNMYKCSLIHHPADGKKYQKETLEIRGQLLFFTGGQFCNRATREEVYALKKKN